MQSVLKPLPAYTLLPFSEYLWELVPPSFRMLLWLKNDNLSCFMEQCHVISQIPLGFPGNLTDFYAYFLSPKIRHRLRTVFEFRKRTDSNFSLVTFSLVPECRTPAAQISGQATPPRTSRAAPRQWSTHSQAAFPSDSHLIDKLPLGLFVTFNHL